MSDVLTLDWGVFLFLRAILAVLVLVVLFVTFNTLTYLRILLRPDKEKFLENKLAKGLPVPKYLSLFLPLFSFLILAPVHIFWILTTYQTIWGVAGSLLLVLNILLSLTANINKINAIHFTTLYPNGKFSWGDAVRTNWDVYWAHLWTRQTGYSFRFLGMNIFWGQEQSIAEKYSTFLRRTFAWMRWGLDKVIVIIAVLMIGFIVFSFYSGGNVLGAGVAFVIGLYVLFYVLPNTMKGYPAAGQNDKTMDVRIKF